MDVVIFGGGKEVQVGVSVVWQTLSRWYCDVQIGSSSAYQSGAQHQLSYNISKQWFLIS